MEALAALGAPTWRQDSSILAEFFKNDPVQQLVAVLSDDSATFPQAHNTLLDKGNNSFKPEVCVQNCLFPRECMYNGIDKPLLLCPLLLLLHELSCNNLLKGVSVWGAIIVKVAIIHRQGCNFSG